MTDEHRDAGADPYTGVPAGPEDHPYADDPYREGPSEPADYAQPYAGLDEPGD